MISVNSYFDRDRFFLTMACGHRVDFVYLLLHHSHYMKKDKRGIVCFVCPYCKSTMKLEEHEGTE